MSLNLPHRNSEYDPEKQDLTGLFDAHINVSDRAESVIYLLQAQFIGDGGTKFNDGVIFSALESVRHDLLDMRELVKHFHEAQNKGK